MVDFVRPGYLGTKKSFSLMFERPIKNGQAIDSTPKDVKISSQRTYVLVQMVRGFIQRFFLIFLNFCVFRRTQHLLKKILPESREYVILVRKSAIQQILYRSFVRSFL